MHQGVHRLKGKAKQVDTKCVKCKNLSVWHVSKQVKLIKYLKVIYI